MSTAIPVPTSDVSAVAQAAAALLAALKQRDAEMNTPAMQRAAEDAAVQAVFDHIQKSVQEKNIDEIREEIAASPDVGTGG